MFALIESRPELRQGSGWTPRLASLAAHTALIALVIYATQRVAVPATPPIFQVDTFFPPAPQQAAAASASSPTSSVPAPFWTMPAPPVNIASEIPAPGNELLPPSGAEPVPGSPVAVSNPPGQPPVASHMPLDARLVDEQPSMLAHPPLHYPEVLRQAGIEGRVLVEAVLDTLGRAEPSSLRVTESPNPLFDREALSVVAGSRYRPGRMDGHAVRVRIQVPVSFSIRR